MAVIFNENNVCLGKVESQLKTHPLVENICVYADSFQFNTVAIMVPIQEWIFFLHKSDFTIYLSKIGGVETLLG